MVLLSKQGDKVVITVFVQSGIPRVYGGGIHLSDDNKKQHSLTLHMFFIQTFNGLNDTFCYYILLFSRLGIHVTSDDVRELQTSPLLMLTGP